MVEMIPILGKRREKYVKLTEKGKEYADYVLAKLYEKEKRIFEKINNPRDNKLGITGNPCTAIFFLIYPL